MASAARSSPAAHAPQASVHLQRLEREQRKSAGCERRPAAEPLRSLTILGRHRRLFIADGREITHRGVTIEKFGTTAGKEKSQPEKSVDGLADTPGSVIPSRCRQRSGGHPSTNAVADVLQQPTRTLGRAALERVLSGLAPGGVYLASPVAQGAGGLLHHRFTLTCGRCKHRNPGGLFSVALACGLPRVGVTHHPALRSPDVPRATYVARDRLANPSALQSTGVRRPAPALSPVISTGADSPAAFRRQDPRCQGPRH